MRRTEPRKKTTREINEQRRLRKVSAERLAQRQQAERAMWLRFKTESKAAGVDQKGWWSSDLATRRRIMAKHHQGSQGKWRFKLLTSFEAIILRRREFTDSGTAPPTNATPGSPEKIQVLVARVAAGAGELHSLDDVKHLPEPYEVTTRKIYRMSDLAMVDLDDEEENE